MDAPDKLTISVSVKKKWWLDPFVWAVCAASWPFGLPEGLLERLADFAARHGFSFEVASCKPAT